MQNQEKNVIFEWQKMLLITKIILANSIWSSDGNTPRPDSVSKREEKPGALKVFFLKEKDDSTVTLPTILIVI